jgi:predicted metal-dependent phosphoesterase TrpH
MMALLHATGYQNSDKMWQVFEIIRGEQKRKKGEADLEQWRANLYQIIREQAEEVETAERERSAVPGYARMAKWAAAHGWTEYYAHDAAQGEKIDAGVRASLDAAFDGKTREECYQAFDLGAQEAYLEALKRQADLLRKILRNPFHRFSDEDFG